MLSALQTLFGEKASINQSILETHGRDENFPGIHPPLAVVFADSVTDIQHALAWAREHQIAVIPFGAGTSFEGQLIPQGPAISLDLSRMNKIIEIRGPDFLVEIEPGVTREQLDKALRYHGLFFPVDPGSNATLGGMAATNASGTTTVRYGGMRPNIAELDVVLANGELLRLGRSVRKTSSGYDLKDLFIGSAGTLGIITRLVLKVYPVPEHIHSMRVFFPNLEAAAQAAYSIMASALPVARLELLDELSVQIINSDLKRDLPEKPALFMEFQSSAEAAIEEESRYAEELVRDAGAIDTNVAKDQKERSAQWEARHHLYWSMMRLYPGRSYVITDVAVPLSQVSALVAYTQQLLKDLRLDGSIIGHVGDGNFHTNVMVSPEQYDRATAFAENIVKRALALGGTATGEHGVGLAKRKFMEEEHGPALNWMRQLKSLFDPLDILNPGKII